MPLTYRVGATSPKGAILMLVDIADRGEAHIFARHLARSSLPLMRAVEVHAPRHLGEKVKVYPAER